MEKFQDTLFELLERADAAALRREMADLNEVDLAEFLEALDTTRMLYLFRILPKEQAADVFSYMPVDRQQTVVESISDQEVRHLVDELFLDDTVDFLEEVPANIVTKVLKNTDDATRHLINQYLKYPENSAGSLMTNEFIDLKMDMTVDQAMQYIRENAVDKETIYTCYVMDERRRLKGIVPLHRLLVAPEPTTPIRVIMDENYQCVHTLDDREETADRVRKYDLLSMPVVDNENRLVGIITADDIMDVIEEENTEDIERMAALTPSDGEYLKTGVLTLARNRIPWLLILMISATFTGKIISSFEEVLAAVTALMAYIPMLMDTAGNSGSQSSVLVIRNLALGEVEPRDILRIIWKEFRVAIIVGVTLAVVNFARIMIFDHVGVVLAVAVCLSLFMTVILSKVMGCVLPIAARKLGFDPAVMASPLITTLVDALSLLIYFFLVTRIFHLA